MNSTTSWSSVLSSLLPSMISFVRLSCINICLLKRFSITYILISVKRHTFLISIKPKTLYFFYIGTVSKFFFHSYLWARLIFVLRLTLFEIRWVILLWMAPFTRESLLMSSSYGLWVRCYFLTIHFCSLKTLNIWKEASKLWSYKQA